MDVFFATRIRNEIKLNDVERDSKKKRKRHINLFPSWFEAIALSLGIAVIQLYMVAYTLIGNGIATKPLHLESNEMKIVKSAPNTLSLSQNFPLHIQTHPKR